MEKLFGGFLLAVATVMLFYRAWLFGGLVLLISLALMFGWESDTDDGEYSTGDGED